MARRLLSEQFAWELESRVCIALHQEERLDSTVLGCASIRSLGPAFLENKHLLCPVNWAILPREDFYPAVECSGRRGSAQERAVCGRGPTSPQLSCRVTCRDGFFPSHRACVWMSALDFKSLPNRPTKRQGGTSGVQGVCV